MGKYSIIRNWVKALLVKQVLPTSAEDRQNDCVLWGTDQAEPVRIAETISRSKTASLCAQAIARYTYGNGFISKKLSGTNANKGQTFDEVLSAATIQIAKFWGVAFRVSYKFDDSAQKFVIASIVNMPFEHCRLGIPDENGVISQIVVNPYFGTVEYKQQYNESYPVFDPTKVAEQIQMGDFKGQILWWGYSDAYARFYPRPSWWGDTLGQGGGKQEMESEYMLGRLLNKELDSGFMQQVILQMIGDPSAPIAEHSDRAADGKNYTTEGEQLKQFLDTEFAGIDGNSMIVFWSRIKEEMPTVTPFPSKFNYDKLKDVASVVAENVAASFGVPPILANIQSSGAISKDDIVSAANLMQANVRGLQMSLTRIFTQLLANWHEPTLIAETAAIENYNPFPQAKEIDPLIWEVLTLEEKRRFIKTNTEYELTDI